MQNTTVASAVIKVIKWTLNQEGTARQHANHVFNFAINRTSQPQKNLYNFTRQDGQPSDSYAVQPGETYSVAEIYDLTEAGWSLVPGQTSCTGVDTSYVDPSYTPSNGTYQGASGDPPTYTWGGIVPAPGDVITCEFTNKPGPNAVELESMVATSQGADVIVAWQTVSDRDVQGFNIFRAASASGPWAKLNQDLIPVSSVGNQGAGSYSWLDAGLSAGTYLYQLESISVSGETSLLEPVSVTVVGPTSVRLSALSATASAWPFAAAGLATLSGLAALAWTKRR
jgi:hypothetical protein